MTERQKSSSGWLLLVGYLILVAGTAGVVVQLGRLGGPGYPKAAHVLAGLLLSLAFLALAGGWWWLSSWLSSVAAANSVAARGSLALAASSMLLAGYFAAQTRTLYDNGSSVYHLYVGSLLVQAVGALVVVAGFIAMFLSFRRN